MTLGVSLTRREPMLISRPFVAEHADPLELERLYRRQLKRPSPGWPRGLGPWQFSGLDPNTALNDPYTPFGIVGVNDSLLPYLASQNRLEDLSPLFPQYQLRFTAPGLRKSTFQGSLYGLPVYTSCRILAYRKDWLDRYRLKPPKTWDELRSQSLFLKKKLHDTNIECLRVDTRPAQSLALLTDLLWGRGTDYFDQDGAFNLRGVAAALAAFRRFFSLGLSRQHDPSVRGQGVMNDFLQGRAAYLYHWSDVLKLMGKLPLAERGRFGWTLAPSSSMTSGPSGIVGGVVLVVPKQSRHKAAGFEALRRLAALSLSAQFNDRFGWPFPAQRAIESNPALRRKHAYYADAQYFLSRGRYIEEAPFLAQNFAALRELAAGELSGWLNKADTHFDSRQAAQRLARGVAALLPPGRLSAPIALALRRLEADLGLPLRIGALARELGWSAPHFIRRFRQETGQSPLQWRQRSRLSQAHRLLQSGQHPCSEVARLLGFATPEQFSRAYKDHYAVSPGTLRIGRQNSMPEP